MKWTPLKGKVKAKIILLILWGCSFILNAVAFGAPPGEVISLAEGPNEIDLNGDKVKDLVLKNWRENHNGHGYYVYLFSIRSAAEAEHPWQVVAIQKPGGPNYSDSLATSEGADCVLKDIRLRRNESGVQLIVAEREFGAGYADSQVVHFTFYRLQQDPSGLPGVPEYAYTVLKSQDSKKKYCDVNQAFSEVLAK